MSLNINPKFLTKDTKLIKPVKLRRSLVIRGPKRSDKILVVPRYTEAIEIVAEVLSTTLGYKFGTEDRYMVFKEEEILNNPEMFIIPRG